MSVQIDKRSKNKIYTYDFWVGGERFHGSTQETTKRAAEIEEQRLKDEAKAALKAKKANVGLPGVRNQRMSVLEACDRLYDEVGQHNASENQNTFLRSMAWIVEFFGKDTLLSEINDDRIAQAVAKRRGEFNEKITKGEPRLVSRNTVDMTMTKRLRQIMLRARDVWKADVESIKWVKHFIGKDEERVREASIDEEAALMDELTRGFDDAVRFEFLSGCRRMEVVGLRWTRVDWFNHRITIVGKGNKTRYIPMDDELHALLWSLKGHHPEFVFTFEAKFNKRLPDGRVLVAGQRYPLRKYTFASIHRDAATKAGLVNWRMHDTRHTTATRTLRVSNLVVVQKLLGHSDPKTTTRYAHVMDDDIRQALTASRGGTDAKSPSKSPSKAWPKAAND